MKYLRPSTLEVCLKELTACEGCCILLAGGTDLVPRYEQGKALPSTLLDLKNIAELRGITETSDGIEIGALTTMQELFESDLICARYKSLWQSTHDFAGVQIRNRATIGGNICNASPAGDTLPPLYAMSAQLRITSSNDDRVLPIKEFIIGPGRISLKPDEIMRSVLLPKRAEGSLFLKLGLRRAMAISVVNLAISYHVTHGRFSELNIATGAVAPTVSLLRNFSSEVMQNPAAINKQRDLVDDEISPIDDVRATAGYRRQVLKNMLSHSLSNLLREHDV